MKLLVAASLLLRLSFADDPSTEHKFDIVLKKIDDEKLSSGKLQQLGSESDICLKLSSSQVTKIVSKIGKSDVWSKLNSKCIVDILKNDKDDFKKIVEDIGTDEKKKDKFFTKHAEIFCELQARFKEVDDWHLFIKKNCEMYTEKQKSEKLQKRIEELEGKLKGSGAEGSSGIAKVSVLAVLGAFALLL